MRGSHIGLLPCNVSASRRPSHHPSPPGDCHPRQQNECRAPQCKPPSPTAGAARAALPLPRRPSVLPGGGVRYAAGGLEGVPSAVQGVRGAPQDALHHPGRPAGAPAAGAAPPCLAAAPRDRAPRPCPGLAAVPSWSTSPARASSSALAPFTCPRRPAPFEPVTLLPAAVNTPPGCRVAPPLHAGPLLPAVRALPAPG